tara:strand:+ start:111 stop:371 length:261 start_codon:yes stop_codon:yes gene_type:complete
MKISKTISLPVCVIHGCEIVDSYGDMVCNLEDDVNPDAIANAMNNFDDMYTTLQECLDLMPVAGESEKQDNLRFKLMELLAKARGE